MIKVLADKDIVDERRLTCFSCPSYNMGVKCETMYNLARCKECGCFISVKSKLNFAECPQGKWKR